MTIAFAHFRIGLTDGVSFEIDKRRAILEEMGHRVVTIAGTHSGPLDLYIPSFEYKQNATIAEINRLSFIATAEAELKSLVEEEAAAIEEQLEQFWLKEQFEVLFLHNLFCLAVCLPGSLAFYRFLKKHPQVKCLTTHHDFYWEAPRVHMFSFTNPYAIQLLETIFPPELPNVRHVVINTLAQQALKDKRGIDAEVVTDTFDFQQPLWTKENYPSDLPQKLGLHPEDLVFLIAVRVRERKAVELSLDVIEAVTRLKTNMVGKTKYDGTPITESSKVVLLIPGEYTTKEEPYIEKLKSKAAESGIDVRWISDIVGSEEQKSRGERQYDLWDCYVWSDAVLYTSHWEGWGNQFGEAVFARKPVVVFEYPVFTSDIRTQGFQVVSLGSTYETTSNGLIRVDESKVTAAAEEILLILTDREKYDSMVAVNFAIGKAKYDTNTRLKRHIQEVIDG